MMLKLYTQDNCGHCITMITKLAEWGLVFDVINISNDPDAKEFMKVSGHKTVPQLYLDKFNVKAGIDTNMFTEEMFYDRLDIFIQKHTFDDIQKLIKNYDENKRIS